MFKEFTSNNHVRELYLPILMTIVLVIAFTISTCASPNDARNQPTKFINSPASRPTHSPPDAPSKVTNPVMPALAPGLAGELLNTSNWERFESEKWGLSWFAPERNSELMNEDHYGFPESFSYHVSDTREAGLFFKVLSRPTGYDFADWIEHELVSNNGSILDVIRIGEHQALTVTPTSTSQIAFKGSQFPRQLYSENERITNETRQHFSILIDARDRWVFASVPIHLSPSEREVYWTILKSIEIEELVRPVIWDGRSPSSVAPQYR